MLIGCFFSYIYLFCAVKLITELVTSVSFREIWFRTLILSGANTAGFSGKFEFILGEKGA